MIKLYPHQEQSLIQTKNKNRVAYYLDMGLGKTFVASEKAQELNKPALVVCQKSKIRDWVEHFRQNYNLSLTVINYDLIWRRPKYLEWTDFTLILDESSLIKNETAKRTKYILGLHPANVILLSGTPTGGKYEKLWSQCRLLGWNISKKLFYDHYIITETIEVGGFPIKKVVGYRNVDRLKHKLRQYGAVFMKTEDVFDLPEQVDIVMPIAVNKEYRRFKRDRYLVFEHVELVGDTSLKQLLYERQLCGQYNKNKIVALKDLIESTNDRMIIFYNFTAEFDIIKTLTDRPISFINGAGMNLTNYENWSDSITLVQYQAGAMGHNLERGNIIVYFTPPLSSELFEQSKKRIHRIGQTKPCFYYYLVIEKSVEEKILDVLKQRQNFTDALFKEAGD
ncbi:MAG: hypothetical protein H6Q73_1796 [Firmicutes bacterium]|nr:hypothetical protein [Bacillota bacterium]